MSAVSHMALLVRAPSGSSPVCTYQTHAEMTGSSPYTFASQAIGTAASDRYVIVGVSWFNATGSGASVSVTVGGISATQLTATTTSGTNGAAALFIAAVPTGTTATIVATISADPAVGCGIGVWIATGLSSPTPLSVANGNASASPALSLSSTSSGGFAIGYTGISSNVAYGATVTWSNVTADWSGTIVTASRTHGGGHATTVSGALTVTPTVSGGNASGVAAAFG